MGEGRGAIVEVGVGGICVAVDATVGIDLVVGGGSVGAGASTEEHALELIAPNDINAERIKTRKVRVFITTLPFRRDG